MDKNKLEELKLNNYKIHKCCGLCQNGLFTGDNIFGYCSKKTYVHLKHTGPARLLSVNKFGSCKDEFEISDKARKLLGDWIQFLG